MRDSKSTPRVPWTPSDDDQLRALYAEHSAAECAALMGRSVWAIHYRASRLGLRKSVEWIAERARQNSLRSTHGGIRTQFIKGHETWNKGRPMPVTGRMALTQFKPGNRPHTWHPIGFERVRSDGYLERKVTDTGVTRRDYVPVQRLVWEANFGPVPAGCAVVFRDGNKRNFEPENLECVTRRDLMRRNTVHNYPPELVDLVRLRGVVTREINKRSRNDERKDEHD